MKIIELDLTGCQYLAQIHEKIRSAFGFSEDYGGNWDAFWDFLWSECDADKVIIKGEHTLPKEFDKDVSVMHEVLDDKIAFNKKCNFNAFSYEIIR